MSGPVPLLAKEWRALRHGRRVFGIVMLVVGLIASLRTSSMAGMALVVALPIFASLPLASLTLSHSLASEWQRNTQYLLMSLPIRRYQIVSAKYLAVVSGSLVLFGLFVLLVLLTPLRDATIETTLRGAPATVLVKLFGSYFLPLLQLLLGIAVFLHGFGLGFGRGRGWLTRLSLVGICVAFAIGWAPITGALAGLGYHEVALLTPRITLTELPYYPAFSIYALASGTFTHY